MAKIMFRKWITIIWLIVVAMIIPKNSYSFDAYVFLKNRIVPIYVQNIKFYYATQTSGRESAICMGRGTYMEFNFNKIRQIKFLKYIGARRNLYPVYRVKISFNESCSDMELTLIPLKMIYGFSQGTTWRYRLLFNEGYKTNIDNIKSIKFIHTLGVEK
ncbi:hypothetical protein JCM12298_19140 [Desulfothermus naphthae]